MSDVVCDFLVPLDSFETKPTFFIPETTIMSIFVQSYQIEYLKAILCAPREFSLLRHSRTK